MLEEPNDYNETKINKSKSLLFEKGFQMKTEFINALNNNDNTFCNSKKIEGIIVNEKFIECSNCYKDYCETCFHFCHKNCPLVTGDIKRFTVFESASSCHCTHNLNAEENKKAIRLECFYSNFIFDNFKLEGKRKLYKLKNKGTIICFFCSMLHEKEENLIEIDNQEEFCQCDDNTHCSFNTRDLFDLFYKCYEINVKDVNHSYLKSQFKNELEKYLNQNNCLNSKLILEYELAKFSSHNLIYNGLLNFSFSDEAELMELLINKLEQKDNYFYNNNEKINMPLTYIFHFYRKKLFLSIGKVNTFIIDIMSFETKKKIIDKHNIFYLKLKESSISHRELFNFDKIYSIMKNILKLKTFKIKGETTLFVLYFIKCFLECYCLTKEDVEELLTLVKEVNFIKNNDEFNNQIRKSIETIYATATKYLMDWNVQKIFKNKINIKKISNQLKDLYINDEFFFFTDQELFEDYFSKLFYNEKIYLQITDKEKQDENENNFNPSFNFESCSFLDCFHYNYLKKYFLDYKTRIKKLNFIQDEYATREYSPQSNLQIERNSTILCYEKIDVLKFKENKFEFFINKIIKYCLPKIDLKRIRNVGEFLRYLFDCLKFLTKNKTKNFDKINISEYVNEEMSISIKNLDLRLFGEELKYIFNEAFNNFKKSVFQEFLNEWNLLLFLLLSNEVNIQFIFLNLRFADFLLTKEIITDSIFLNENSRREVDFTFKFLYLAYNFYIHNSEWSAEFDYIIKNNYLKICSKYISETYDKINEKNKFYLKLNYYFIYYYLKILMKMYNSFEINYNLPFSFNNTYSILNELEILAIIIFESNLDCERYLEYNSKSQYKPYDSENTINENNSMIEPFDNLNGRIESIEYLDSRIESLDNLNEETDNLFTQESINRNKNNSFNRNMKNSIFEMVRHTIKPKNIAKYKSIGIANIQFLLLKILGSFSAITCFDLYFKILNKNFYVFQEFFENKLIFLFKFQHKEKQIYKLEMVIVNFLFNFLVLKYYDFLTLKTIHYTDITKSELITLAKENPENTLIMIIEFSKRPIEAKYLIFKLKCKILELIEIYISKLDDGSFYFNDNFKIFKLYVIYYFSWLLKDLQINSKLEFNNNEYKQRLITLLSNFLNKLDINKVSFSENLASEDDTFLNKLENKQNEYEKNKKNYYEQLQKKFNESIKTLPNTELILEYHKIDFLNNLITDSLVIQYFKTYLTYDNRKHSIYSSHIYKFIQAFSKDETYKLSDNLKDKINISDDLFDLETNNIFKELSFKIWDKVNKNIISSKFNKVLIYLFKYIFNCFKAMQIIENMECNNSKNFDFIFSPTLLKMVNFLNNILYYYQQEFQETLLQGISVENFKLLLKILIKLNNYIIGISDFADNLTLISLSRKYFIFMDFFILLSEGKISREFVKIFFENFDENEEDKKCLGENEYNFYFQCFSQLRKIIELINVKTCKGFSFGSFRLLIQFLYLTRFLKEFLEDDIKENDTKKAIINKCFEEIFDFNWLINDYIKNQEYSFLLRFELLTLLNAYLVEFSDKISNEFNYKINEFFNNDNKVFQEIIKCFEIAIEELKNSNKLINQKLNNSFNIDDLISVYLADEVNLYKNKYFDLAELYYILLKLLNPNFQSFKEENEKNNNLKKFTSIDKTENNLIYYKFLRRFGREIEVKFKDTANKFKFRKIYFFKSPKCFWLNEKIKRTFLEEAPRNSIGEKLHYFNKKLDLILLQINVCYLKRPKNIIKNQNNLFAFFKINILFYLDKINFIFVFLLNCFLISYFNIDTHASVEDLNSQIFNFSRYRELTYVFPYTVHSVVFISLLQIFILIIWYYTYYKIILTKSKFNRFFDKKYLLKDYADEKEFRLDSFSAYDQMLDKFDTLNKDHSYLNLKFKFSTNFSDIIYSFNLILMHLRIIFWNKEIKYVMFSLICHLLFLIFNNHLFIILPMISIIRTYSLFDYFLKAILSKASEFFALLIFIYVIEYIFSWITFLYFQDFMIYDYLSRSGDLNKTPNYESLCSSAMECFMNFLDLGLRLGGGIGDVSPRISYKFDDRKKYYLKLLWEVIFHIFVNLILGNIFFGVIVDTFNDLRDQKDIKNADKKNKCFMCHRDRYENDSDEDFDIHRIEKHGIFNYIYFIPYLLKKNPQIYSREEQFAWQQFNMKKLDWYPYIKENDEDNSKIE